MSEYAARLAYAYDCLGDSESDWLRLAAMYGKYDALMQSARKNAVVSTAKISIGVVEGIEDQTFCFNQVTFGGQTFNVVYFAQAPPAFDLGYAWAWQAAKNFSDAINAQVSPELREYFFATVTPEVATPGVTEYIVEITVHPYYNESPELWNIVITPSPQPCPGVEGVFEPVSVLQPFTEPISPLTPNGVCIPESDHYAMFAELYDLCCECGIESDAPAYYYSVVDPCVECDCGCPEPPVVIDE